MSLPGGFDSDAVALLALRALPQASVIVFDADLRIVLAAGQALARNDMSRVQLEGRLASEAISPERWEVYQPPFRAALEGRSSSVEIEGLSDGRWYSVDVEPLRNASGTIVGGVSFSRDITERRAAGATSARLAGIIANTDDAIVSVSTDGMITSFNPGAERLYGYASTEAMGKPIATLYPPAIAAREWHLLPRVLAGEHIVRHETTRRCKDGRDVDVSLTLSPVHDADGRTIGAASIARDITEPKRALAALREAEERFRSAFEEAPIGMVLASLDGRFMSVNEAFADFLGYAREELVGMSFESIVQPDHVKPDREVLRAMRAGERTSYSTEGRLVHASGRSVHGAAHATVISGADGSPQYLLAQVQDITDRKRHEQQLEYLADHDALTGLLNRRAFARELDAHAGIVERYGTAGTVLMLDLDHFKYVNDTLGHGAGDELIVRVARLLSARLRGTDVLARLGGDEFGVLLPRADSGAALGVAESLLETLRREPIPIAGIDRRITASIGLASFADQNGASGEDLLVNADLALYDAKEEGRDRAARFSTADHAQARMKGRITWAQRIRSALEHDRFTLLAQPIVSLATGDVGQYELLLRMVDEQGDLIRPGAFLEVAERLDLVQHIDSWVVSNAMRLLSELEGRGEGVQLEINLSGRSIGDSALLEHIDSEIRNAGVSPDHVIFEVTETAAISSIAQAREFSERLYEIGCRFALDDFGAGFGSFYYLKHLRFDFLKIDGEFVQNCRASDIDRLVIQAVVAIARGLRKSTIAERVGDDETIALLTGLGVQYGQGYHLGEPAPLADQLAPV